MDLRQDGFSEEGNINVDLDIGQLNAAASPRFVSFFLVDLLLLFFNQLSDDLVEDNNELVPTVGDFIHHFRDDLEGDVHLVDYSRCVRYHMSVC
jgi:hypothetical protein